MSAGVLWGGVSHRPTLGRLATRVANRALAAKVGIGSDEAVAPPRRLSALSVRVATDSLPRRGMN